MLLCPYNSPGKSSGVGGHFLLQGIFPNPGTEPGSPTLQADSLPSCHQGSPHPILRTIYIAHIYLTFNNLRERILYNGEKVFPPIPNPTITLFLPNARKVCKTLFTRANIFVVAFTGKRNLSDQVHTGGPPCLLTFQNSSRFCIAKLVQTKAYNYTRRLQELPVISILLLR